MAPEKGVMEQGVGRLEVVRELQTEEAWRDEQATMMEMEGEGAACYSISEISKNDDDGGS